MSGDESPRAWGWLGGVLLAVGVWLLADHAFFVARSRPAMGTVVDRTSTGYSLRYSLPDGGAVTFGLALPASPEQRERIEVGRSIPVRYRPDAPTEARAVEVGYWWAPFGFVLTGALGLFAAWYARHAPRG